MLNFNLWCLAYIHDFLFFKRWYDHYFLFFLFLNDSILAILTLFNLISSISLLDLIVLTGVYRRLIFRVLGKVWHSDLTKDSKRLQVSVFRRLPVVVRF